MFRVTMLLGWYQLLRNPRRIRPDSVGSVGDFVLIHPGKSKRPSAGNGQGEKPSGVLPSPADEKRMSVPEPGDVAKRHETTNLFEDSDDEKPKSRRRGDDEDVV